VVGGGDSNATFSDGWRYDPEADSWIPIANAPQPMRHGAAFSVNGKGYVMCGQASTNVILDQLFCYDPVTNSWTEKASLPAYPRYGPHGFAIGGFGYLGGGNRGSANGPYLDDMWKYDPLIDQWSSSIGIPGLPRYGATAFVINGKGFVQGGRDSSLDFTSDLWEFDPVALDWTIRPEMPGVGRSWSMVMTFPYEAVVGGGKDVALQVFNDAYRYQPSANSWVALPDYPGGSGWSGASFGIGTRTFGGLGKLLFPSTVHFNDLWELVKRDENSILEQGRNTDGVIQVVPNPVTSGSPIAIVFEGKANPDLRGELVVTDAVGRVVHNERVMLKEAIQLPALSSGQYVVRYLDTYRTWSAQLVVR